MVLEVVVGGAALGLFSAALVNQFTVRVANKTIDVAAEEVDRVMAWWRGDRTGDPETQWMLRATVVLDLESRVRVATQLVSQMEKDDNAVVITCVQDMQNNLNRIKDILRDIKCDLIEHQKGYFSHWLFSNIRPMVDALKVELDAMDKRIELLYRIKLLAISTNPNRSESSASSELVDTKHTILDEV